MYNMFCRNVRAEPEKVGAVDKPGRLFSRTRSMAFSSKKVHTGWQQNQGGLALHVHMYMYHLVWIV